MLVRITGLATGEILSRLLKRLLTVPPAKGLAYFVVSLLIFFIFKRGSGAGPLVPLGWCLLVGLLAFIGTQLWPTQ